MRCSPGVPRLGAYAGIEFAKFGGQGLVIDEQLAETDEGADDDQAHLHGAGAVQDIGGLQGSVFGEGVREDRRKLEGAEVVTICNHLGLLVRRELKHEVRGKARAEASAGRYRNSGRAASHLTAHPGNFRFCGTLPGGRSPPAL